jgi:phosphatidylinositol kinase/protein kinase (PI-3  family)
VVKCIGSDGKSYKQLVKGKDDLRQDAVLSKAFDLINTLLQRNIDAKKRELQIRTYRIIPIASRAGVVEWVNNAVPFGDMLINGYSKFPPKWSLNLCRQKMKKEHDRPRSSLESKLKVYDNIESHIAPVFGHVLFELFPSPDMWYIARLKFIRSLAASSIAGFIFGVGDRHSQNILIDNRTAEVVHIDLGIAFDQGKLLTTPELVPFRLTRNFGWI